MKNILLFLALLLMFSVSVQAQFFTLQKMDSIRAATNEDYQAMLAQFQITSMREGPSGNPQAPNAANSDESKATPYISLPDRLMLINGERVTDARTW